MKKKPIFFAILGFFLGLGIILIIVGIALGGRFQNLSISEYEKTYKHVSTDLPNISLTDTTDIRRMDVDISASKITIQRSDTFSVEGNSLSTNKVQNGTWTIESSWSDHFYRINIFGIVQIPFPYRYHKKITDNITITIPKDVSLEEMDMELSASDVTIEELNSDNIDLEVSAGQVTIDSITAKSADLSVAAGDITVHRYNITGSASIDCSLGNIDFGTRKYSLENICNNLEADCSMGNIDVYGKLTGNSELDCSMGDITLNLVGSHANYDITSDTSLGDISHNTKNFIKKSGGNNDISTSNDNSKYGTLDLSCSMGNIDVYYLYSTDRAWEAD